MRHRGLIAVVLALLALPADARGQGVDQTCVLALTAFDPAVVNTAFPDDSARYFLGAYQQFPGTRIRLQGTFPHARYMSFNTYDLLLRPLDALADDEIVPAPGHTNPFVVGADRTAAQRDFTAFIEYGPPPAQRAPNTLYTGAPPNSTGVFIYRIYIPDRGRDEYGDAGLPTATIELSNGAPAPRSLCTQLKKPSIEGVNEFVANSEGLPETGLLPAIGARNPPRWRKFTNVASAVVNNALDADSTDALWQTSKQLDLDTRGGKGGFLSNIHNAYLSASTNRVFGRVLEVRLTPPTFPDTRPGTPIMPAGQLRYWSMCTNDPMTQRFYGCLNDDRTRLDAGGRAVFVISTPANRPANARPACGINWLPWGGGPRGVLIYRHMLPADGFTASIQTATVDREAETMGDGFPASRYFATKADYEARGCTMFTARRGSSAARSH